MNGRWGLVCPDALDKVDARVLCKSLSKEFLQSLGSARSSYRGPRYGGSLVCRGSENRMEECDIQLRQVSSCDGGADAAIICTTGKEF